jgi:membrane-associated phospholipid phosphatase
MQRGLVFTVRNRPGALALAVSLVAAAASAPANAQETPRPLAYDLRIDLPVTAVLGLADGAFALWGPRLAANCRWCDRNPDGSDNLNELDHAVRLALLAPDPAAAATTSDVIAYGLAPASAIALTAVAGWRAGQRKQIWVDLMILVETAAAAELLDEIAKFSFARERPYAHALYATRGPSHVPEDNVSFYSGHTNFTFALAVASGTIATLRGYRLAPWIWGVGMALAVTTGYLRIAGDKHYFTDVLVGAVAGSAVGFVVPWLHQPRRVALRPFAHAQGTGGVLGVAGVF